jgi:2-haloacid dehalogenase
VLQQLRGAGLTTAILSNGTPEMLAAAVENAGLGPLFDQVLSVEAVGVHKPHARVCLLACDRLGLAAEAIAFVSSNAWDAHAASAFGMRVVWCNRQAGRRERLPGNRATRSARLPNSGRWSSPAARRVRCGSPVDFRSHRL